MNTKDSFLKNFLLEDYKLKVQYLTDHFSRMWTRFNFFLTINSALFAFSVQKDTAAFTPLFVVAGILLSALWFFFGVTDNYLVEVYRKPVETPYYLLVSEEQGLKELLTREGVREVYSYVGDTKTKFLVQEDGKERVSRHPTEPNPLQWRVRPDWEYRGWKIETISATELAAILPLGFFLLWIARLFAA